MILAFDVRVEREAQELADSLGVKIFPADIIYHLFDNFLKHRAVCLTLFPNTRAWEWGRCVLCVGTIGVFVVCV